MKNATSADIFTCWLRITINSHTHQCLDQLEFHHTMSQDFKSLEPGGEVEMIPTSTSQDESSHLAHSALAYVDNHSQPLDNLEPSLAALSDTLRHSPHPTVTSSQIEQNSIALAAVDIATSSLAAHDLTQSPAETPKAKRLNRACDACSRRKVKVCFEFD